MRTHVQTAGVSLTAQQPLNNITRTAIEALAGVLGGTQSLHTNSYDEALALPTEEAVRIALRTQQVIAHETGVTNTIDPLGGSYFVEALTDEIEAQRVRVLRQDRRARRDGRGGQAQLPAARDRRRGVRAAAGDRRAATGSSSASTTSPRATTASSPILRIDPALERKQIDRVQAVRARRDGAAVERALGALRGRGRATTRNLMPNLLDCARVHATEGEIVARAAGRVRHLHRDTRSSDRPRRASREPARA